MRRIGMPVHLLKLQRAFESLMEGDGPVFLLVGF